MADNLKTVADIAAVNGNDLHDGNFDDVLSDAPVLAAVDAVQSSKGNIHEYKRKTAAPVVGYVGDGVGRDLSKSVKEKVTDELKALDASFEIPVHVADSDTNGAEAAIEEELGDHLGAFFAQTEKQMIGGTVGGDATGNKGFADQITNTDSLGCVNAGGTGTGLTSVWLVRFSKKDGVAPVIDKDINVAPSTIIQSVAANGKKQPVYFTPVQGKTGVQIGTNYSLARVCNINAANKLTDALIAKAIKKLPATKKPTHIIMNSDAMEMLQSSRTATSPTGAPAEFPNQAFNIPIIETGNIGSDEAALVATP